jgi:hypothetical protein
MKKIMIIMTISLIFIFISIVYAAKINIKKGQTNVILDVFISNSLSTTGGGLTGLTYNSSGLTAYYIRPGQTSDTAIPLVSTTIGTYTSGGFVEIDSVHLPGLYEFDPPNAIFSEGSNSAVIFLNGAINMVPLPMELQLYDIGTPSSTIVIGVPTNIY